jgi:hypothetical protein
MQTCAFTILLVVLLLYGKAIAEAAPVQGDAPAGTYECARYCSPQVINGQQCEVCQITYCKIEDGKRTDKIYGTKKRTTCQGTGTPPRTRPRPPGVQPPRALITPEKTP